MLKKFKFREAAAGGETGNSDKKKAGVEGSAVGDGVEAKAAESTAAGDDGVDAQAQMDKGGDAAQDKDVFKKLIGEYLGQEHAENTEAQAMAKEMYESASESGMAHEEAMKCAGYGMKASSAMGASKAKKEAAAKEAAKVTEAAGKKEADAKGKEDGAMEAKKESVKESAAPSFNKLVAENAALRETIRKGDFAKHLDTVLGESKLPRSATKVFRESLAPRLKTTKEIDEELKKFRESFIETESGRDEDLSDGFGACVEKINPQTSGSSDGQFDGFGDCLN